MVVVEFFEHVGFQFGLVGQVVENVGRLCRCRIFEQIGDLGGPQPGQPRPETAHPRAIFGGGERFECVPSAVSAVAAETTGQVVPPAAPLHIDTGDRPAAAVRDQFDVAGTHQLGDPHVEKPASEHIGDQQQLGRAPLVGFTELVDRADHRRIRGECQPLNRYEHLAVVDTGDQSGDLQIPAIATIGDNIDHPADAVSVAVDEWCVQQLREMDCLAGSAAPPRGVGWDLFMNQYSELTCALGRFAALDAR